MDEKEYLRLKKIIEDVNKNFSDRFEAQFQFDLQKKYPAQFREEKLKRILDK